MLTYRAGDADRPRGHALLFFQDADDPDVAWATYLVVAPIAMDLAKYIPAAFAPQMATQMAGQVPTAYPLPPMPEKVEGGLAWLERMARLRGDDLLDGGVLRVSEPWQTMQPVASVAQEYADRFNAYAAQAEQESVQEPESSGPTGAAAVDVDDLLLQVMPDREKVGRLARLTGTLRYAVEGGDARLVEETVGDMERVGRQLSDKFRVTDLIAAARSTAPNAGKLAELYVERAYRLVDEDYAALPDLERRIEEARESRSPEP